MVSSCLATNNYKKEINYKNLNKAAIIGVSMADLK